MPTEVPKRYDRDVLGQLNHDYDVVCPKCCSAVGFPCTQLVRDGQTQINEVHQERKDININNYDNSDHNVDL